MEINEVKSKLSARGLKFERRWVHDETYSVILMPKHWAREHGSLFMWGMINYLTRHCGYLIVTE